MLPVSYHGFTISNIYYTNSNAMFYVQHIIYTRHLYVTYNYFHVGFYFPITWLLFLSTLSLSLSLSMSFKNSVCVFKMAHFYLNFYLIY